MSKEKIEDIWQAFERILEEHGPLEMEMPEEAARKRAIDTGRLIDLGDFTIERIGGDGIDDFLAGVEWAQKNPAALVNWKRGKP